jgi:hypothetical protein
MEGLDESMDCCWWCVGDGGLDLRFDGAVWSNLSKNVLFLFDNVRTGDCGVDGVISGGIDVGIGIGIDIGFVGFWVILVDGIVVVILVFVDDDDDDVGDEAKYTVSVVIRER